MKTVLVLGATGFVGTHVSLALTQEPCHLILACRSPQTLHPDLHKVKTRLGDMGDHTYLTHLFQGVDVVINAFAWTSLFGDATLSHTLFYQPTIALIDAAKEAGVRRFINLSTLSAAPNTTAHDANSEGTLRGIWPHLDNVVRIESHLRTLADPSFQVINLRCGLFVGEHYALGLLPILLPRLKTHLVPLVSGGVLPLIDGSDVAQAFVKAALTSTPLAPFEGFNILGPEVPELKTVLRHLHRHHGYPYPHFSVPFALAYPFAQLMEWLDPLLPFDPLVTRSIIHLLEPTHTDNAKAWERLHYRPQSHWRDAVDRQVTQLHHQQTETMPMRKAIMSS